MFRFGCFGGGLKKSTKPNSKKSKRKRVSTRRPTAFAKSPANDQHRAKPAGHHEEESREQIKYVPTPNVHLRTESKSETFQKHIYEAEESELDHDHAIADHPRLCNDRSSIKLIPPHGMDHIALDADFVIPPIQIIHSHSTMVSEQSSTLQLPASRKQANSTEITRNRMKKKKQKQKQSSPSSEERKKRLKQKLKEMQQQRSKHGEYKIDLNDSGFMGPKRYNGDSPLPAPPRRRESHSRTSTLSNININLAMQSPSDTVTSNNVYSFDITYQPFTPSTAF